MAKRLKVMGAAKYQTDGDPRTSGPGFGVAVHREVLTEPLRWRHPRMAFVNSMSDLGHARVGRDFLAAVFAVMAVARQHTFQVLTKRPCRLRAALTSKAFCEQATAIGDIMDRFDGPVRVDDMNAALRWIEPRERLRGEIPAPLPNVWVGTSIESNEYCWRADELRALPAATRFLSMEAPLGALPSPALDRIDWVIVGGESGPRHRPMDLAWVRDIRDRCADRCIPFFLKQIGGVRPKSGGGWWTAGAGTRCPAVRPSSASGVG